MTWTVSKKKETREVGSGAFLERIDQWEFTHRTVYLDHEILMVHNTTTGKVLSIAKRPGAVLKLFEAKGAALDPQVLRHLALRALEEQPINHEELSV